MGLFELFAVIVGIALVAALATWLLGQIPNVPPIISSIIWALAVVVIVVIILTAIGVFGHDVRVPHI
jgi:hypothetical protein